MRSWIAGVLALLFMRKQKPKLDRERVTILTCHRCPKQITLSTMCLIVDDYNPVCAECYAAAMTMEEHRCANYDLL